MTPKNLPKISRTTSVQITSLTETAGHAHAEDMHGIPCFIDHRTNIDQAPRPGLIFDADICEQGFVIQARSTDATR